MTYFDELDHDAVIAEGRVMNAVPFDQFTEHPVPLFIGARSALAVDIGEAAPVEPERTPHLTTESQSIDCRTLCDQPMIGWGTPGPRIPFDWTYMPNWREAGAPLCSVCGTLAGVYPRLT